MKKGLKKWVAVLMCTMVLMSAMSGTVLAAKKASLNKTSVTISVGESVTLKLNGSSIKSAKSNNKRVAAVNNNGKVTGKKKGKVTITITGKNKKKYKCKVTVKKRRAYTKKELGKLAQDYYERHYAIRLSYSITEENGVFAIQLFEDFPDHIATYDWYYVNKYGIGKDILGDPIDLNR